MKKIIGLFVVTLLVTTVVLPVAGTLCDSTDQLLEMNKKNARFNSDEIDQQQPTKTGNTFLMGDALKAQSFVPTKNELTRVELFVYKHGTMNADFVVSIREELTGSDLTVASKQANQIPSDINLQDWVEFDFNDIQVTPGDTYYIVCTTQGGNLDNCYVLGMANNDPYPQGDAWEYGVFTGYVWEKMEDPSGRPYDLCFRTYVKKGKAKSGYENQLFLQLLKDHSRILPLLETLLQQCGL